MIVKFKCACMQDEATVVVPERLPDQDVTDWVERTCGLAILAKHTELSPGCRSRVMEYAKIPLPRDGSSPIGTLPLDS